MTKLILYINDEELKRLGIEDKEIDFEELKDKLLADAAKEGMDRILKASEESGLSEMTLDEINEEIRAARQERAQRKSRA